VESAGCCRYPIPSLEIVAASRPGGFLGGLFLDVFVGDLLRSLAGAWKGRGSGSWPTANATVTADPASFHGFGGGVVEVVYSYRFEGEPYTGLHEEPVFGGSDIEHIERFPKGRSFVVRVKPTDPEVSVVGDGDQTDGIRKRLERMDEHDRNASRKPTP